MNIYFLSYESDLIKNNECYFTLNVVVKEGFFIKQISESYMIERGHVYEEFN